MDRSRHIGIMTRKVSALVAALSLILHVGLMALSAPPTSLPLFGQGASAHKVHHSHEGGDPRQDDRGKAAGHEKPCCILGFLSGVPAPAPGSVQPPAHPAVILSYVAQGSPETAPSVDPYPVGARAPPVTA
jgi:hypothetical protein